MDPDIYMMYKMCPHNSLEGDLQAGILIHVWSLRHRRLLYAASRLSPPVNCSLFTAKVIRHFLTNHNIEESLYKTLQYR